MRHNILLFGSILLLSVCASCHHHDDNDTVAPTLSILSPTADASLTGTVSIAGTTADEKSLHEISIVVTNDSDGAELFKAEPEVHNKANYSISEVWAPSGLGAETPVTLTVTVEDHGENKTVQTVKFKAKS
jgi:hypothetical protein